MLKFLFETGSKVSSEGIEGNGSLSAIGKTEDGTTVSTPTVTPEQQPNDHFYFIKASAMR